MEIQNYHSGAQGDKVLATFDIYFPKPWCMTWKKWKVLRGKNGSFIVGPSYGEEDGNGGKRFFQYIQLSSEKKTEFEKQLRELLKPFNDGKDI